MTLEDVERRIAAKRFNEKAKLLATFLNNIGLAFLIGGLVQPYIADPLRSFPLDAVWFLVLGPLLHVVGRLVLETMRSED